MVIGGDPCNEHPKPMSLRGGESLIILGSYLPVMGLGNSS